MYMVAISDKQWSGPYKDSCILNNIIWPTALDSKYECIVSVFNMDNYLYINKTLSIQLFLFVVYS